MCSATCARVMHGCVQTLRGPKKSTQKSALRPQAKPIPSPNHNDTPNLAPQSTKRTALTTIAFVRIRWRHNCSCDGRSMMCTMEELRGLSYEPGIEVSLSCVAPIHHHTVIQKLLKNSQSVDRCGP
jgi:hypothetical protein